MALLRGQPLHLGCLGPARLNMGGNKYGCFIGCDPGLIKLQARLRAHTMRALTHSQACSSSGRHLTAPIKRISAKPRRSGSSGLQPAASAHGEQPSLRELGDSEARGLASAVSVALVTYAFVGGAGAARADDGWMPRRHHRHMDERFSSTWAGEIVEVGAKEGGPRSAISAPFAVRPHPSASHACMRAYASALTHLPRIMAHASDPHPPPVRSRDMRTRQRVPAQTRCMQLHACSSPPRRHCPLRPPPVACTVHWGPHHPSGGARA